VDPWRRVQTVVLSSQAGAGGAWGDRPLEPEGEGGRRFVVAAALDERWYAEARSVSGEVLARAGSRDEPFVRRSAQGPVLTERTTPATSSITPRLRTLAWVATAVAVVAAGVGTGFQVSSVRSLEASQREEWVAASRAHHQQAVEKAGLAAISFAGTGVAAGAAAVLFVW
jgi:hypothetical protein